MPIVSKVTNANGSRLLGQLFLETATRKRETAPYTLKDYDYRGKPSLYRLYMEESDPTEYRFANKYLADWQHWKRLCECEWFKETVARWREELDLKLQAEALSRIIEESKQTGREGHSASKYLLEKGWLKDTKGRPSKAQVSDAAHKIASENTRLKEDAARLGVNVSDFKKTS